MPTADADDLDRWMADAQGGDRDAYARVVEACHHVVRAVVLRETADPELADEIAQDVFVRAWVKRHQYRPGSSPRAWLLGIARYRLMEHHRRRSRNRRHLPDLIRRELLRRADQALTAEEATDSRRRDALDLCLGEVPPEQRELLELVHGDGLATGDAAEVLGIQAATCRQRLSRLQRALGDCVRQRLEGSA